MGRYQDDFAQTGMARLDPAGSAPLYWLVALRPCSDPLPADGSNSDVLRCGEPCDKGQECLSAED